MASPLSAPLLRRLLPHGAQRLPGSGARRCKPLRESLAAQRYVALRDLRERARRPTHYGSAKSYCLCRQKARGEREQNERVVVAQRRSARILGCGAPSPLRVERAAYHAQPGSQSQHGLAACVSGQSSCGHVRGNSSPRGGRRLRSSCCAPRACRQQNATSPSQSICRARVRGVRVVMTSDRQRCILSSARLASRPLYLDTVSMRSLQFVYIARDGAAQVKRCRSRKQRCSLARLRQASSAASHGVQFEELGRQRTSKAILDCQARPCKRAACAHCRAGRRMPPNRVDGCCGRPGPCVRDARAPQGSQSAPTLHVTH